LPGGGTVHLVRASRPDFTSEPGVLTIVGAGFDPTDSTITRRTLIEPIEHFLVETGDAPMQARHTARVMTRRIALSDHDRLAQARSSLTDVTGTDLVQAAIGRQEALLAAIG
jgi:hypothetical protein